MIETEFLGLIVGRIGVKVREDCKKSIIDWPKPTNITDLRSFFGLAQFFRRLVKDFSNISAPLSNLTRTNSNINNWGE